MDRKLIAVLTLLLASCGCCACDNSCDYLPPVLDGPYSCQGARSGSLGTSHHPTPQPFEGEHVVGEVITPLEAAE